MKSTKQQQKEKVSKGESRDHILLHDTACLYFAPTMLRRRCIISILSETKVVNTILGKFRF